MNQDAVRFQATDFTGPRFEPISKAVAPLTFPIFWKNVCIDGRGLLVHLESVVIELAAFGPRLGHVVHAKVSISDIPFFDFADFSVMQRN